jgi:hypothetical protein
MDIYIIGKLSPEIRMKRDNLLVAERVIEKGKAVLKATAEARDRRYRWSF